MLRTFQTATRTRLVGYWRMLADGSVEFHARGSETVLVGFLRHSDSAKAYTYSLVGSRTVLVGRFL